MSLVLFHVPYIALRQSEITLVIIENINKIFELLINFDTRHGKSQLILRNSAYPLLD